MICLGSGSSINSQKQNIAPSTCPAGDTASAPQHGWGGEGLLEAAWSVYCSAVSLSREVSAASAAKQRPAAQSPARQQPGSRSCGCSAQFVLTGRFLSSCWDFKKTRRASNFCIFFFLPDTNYSLKCCVSKVKMCGHVLRQMENDLTSRGGETRVSFID